MSERKGLLFCLGCISLIPGIKDRLVNNMSFHPPAVKGYKYSRQCNKVLLFDHSRGKYVTMNEVMRNMVKLVPGRCQVRVKFMTINSTDVFYYINQASKLTIIYSHSNATDIGYLFGHLFDLAYKANVNIISYEYSGYGQSKGKPSEKSIHEDVCKIFEYSTSKLKLDPGSIILYGQSIGSVPTIHLASKYANMNLGGVVVHSGIKSAVSVICNSRTDSTLPWYDSFKNIDKIQKVRCPVFVIHGTNDTIIPHSHGEMLYKLAPNKYTPWFVDGANHCNIEVNWRNELTIRLKRFLAYVSSNLSSNGSPDVKPLNKNLMDNDNSSTLSRVSTVSSQSFERINLDDLYNADDSSGNQNASDESSKNRNKYNNQAKHSKEQSFNYHVNCNPNGRGNAAKLSMKDNEFIYYYTNTEINY